MHAAVLLAALLGQSPSGPPTDMARIRKALEQPAPLETSLKPPDGVVFRVTVRAPKPQRPLWEAQSIVPSYVRPAMPITHYEFLSQTTNEFFRAGVLYPGMSLGSLLNWLGSNKSKEQVRRDKEAKARKEVAAEFEAFLKGQTIK